MIEHFRSHKRSEKGPEKLNKESISKIIYPQKFYLLEDQRGLKKIVINCYYGSSNF